MSNVKIDANVHLDVFSILARCVSEGVQYGMRRAYKYSDEPTREVMEDEIERAVVANLCDILIFEDGPVEEDNLNN
jgi:hypothetical protein